MPGCGKSTYVKNHLKDRSLAYDLDAIAAAFRLKMPHDEYHDGARKMANDMLFGWLDNAKWYCDDVFIIRTAPNFQELNKINPDEVVICSTQYVYRNIDNDVTAASKIHSVKLWCERLNKPYKII